MPAESEHTTPSTRHRTLKTAFPFAAFALFLGLWTWKLLEPNPVPEAISDELSAGARFLFAKLLHVGAYGFLTLLAATLPVRRPYFWVAVATLAVHAVGTEIGQTYVPNRNGSARDVLFDWAGVGMGLLALAAVRRWLSSAAVGG